MTDESSWIAEAKARCEKATPGPWRSRGMGGDSYVLAPTHQWHSAAPNNIGFPIAVPRTYGESGDTKIDFSSAGFSHSDARFIAHARTDLPRALSEIESLSERLRAAKAELEMVNEQRDTTYRSLESTESALSACEQKLAEADATIAALRNDAESKAEEIAKLRAALARWAKARLTLIAHWGMDDGSRAGEPAIVNELGEAEKALTVLALSSTEKDTTGS
jgi:hypothetical protein